MNLLVVSGKGHEDNSKSWGPAQALPLLWKMLFDSVSKQIPQSLMEFKSIFEVKWELECSVDLENTVCCIVTPKECEAGW